MSSIKDFKDQNGYVLAHAAIPDGYQIGGSLVNGFQHESVPFFVTVHAVNPETKAIIYGLTDEKYTTYKNQMIKMTLKAMSDVKWNSIRDFIEPEVYLDTFAAALSGMPSIKAVGKADLPRSKPSGRRTCPVSAAKISSRPSMTSWPSIRILLRGTRPLARRPGLTIFW